jgi:hypothetical protein
MQMPLFLVVALKDSAPFVDEAVASKFPENSYKIEPGKWAVNADATTAKELAVKLGVRETQSHLVVPIRGYSGRAQPDFWEWLAAQSAKING